MGRDIWDIFVPSPQFCHESKAALKNKVYLLKTLWYSKESSCTLKKNWKLAEKNQKHFSPIDMIKIMGYIKIKFQNLKENKV